MNGVAVYSRWMKDVTRSQLGWGVGLLAVVSIYLGSYATMRSSDLMAAKIDAMPAHMVEAFGMHDILSAPGYVHTTVFALMGLLLLLIMGMSAGARAIAGDEEAGTLEMTLAHAVSRTEVWASRLLGVFTQVLVLSLLVGGAVAALNQPVGLDLPWVNIAAATASLLLLVLFHAWFAFAVGALTGRRAVAILTTTVIAAAGYVANTMGHHLAEWVPRASPFHWAYAHSPLRYGFDTAGLLALGAACVACAAMAWLGFIRRDLHRV